MGGRKGGDELFRLESVRMGGMTIRLAPCDSYVVTGGMNRSAASVCMFARARAGGAGD